jgi:hypothetical protein
MVALLYLRYHCVCIPICHAGFSVFCVFPIFFNTCDGVELSSALLSACFLSAYVFVPRDQMIYLECPVQADIRSTSSSQHFK